MNYYNISNNVKVSTLCFGCEPLGGTDWGEINVKDIEEAIEYAVYKGVNFFDTADIYGLGLSETRLSKILGSKRHDLQIATKGGVSWDKPIDQVRANIKFDNSPKYLKKAIDNSLKRLKLDKLPIYYIHWPDNITDIRATFEFLNSQQENGKIGLIGCSNFTSLQMAEASEVANVSFAQLPLNLISGNLSDDIVSVCNKFDIKVVAYNVLESGLLTGKYDDKSKFSEDDRRSKLAIFKGEAFENALKIVDLSKEKAKKLNLSLSEYSIKMVLEEENVCSVITGIKNIKQIQENIKAVL